MKLPGNRIVKTAVAVFLTALLCNLIGWPPVFAVITAIVTLEPTVSDSIKKGIVRFPASAIGSFYAVLFIALFGNSALTYTLAASLTIITCYRFKLHAGLLVATITAVAMIEVVYDNYLLSFFIRLGTTTIGIVVSTLVNMLILPPNYMKEINRNLQSLYVSLGQALENILEPKTIQDSTIENINKKLHKTEELIRFQQDESYFHPLVDSKKESFTLAKQQLSLLRFIHYHLSNLEIIGPDSVTLQRVNQETITTAVKDLSSYMMGAKGKQIDHHEQELRKLMDLYWRSSLPSNNKNSSELPQELILLYELISIFYIVKQLEEISNEKPKPALD